MKKVFLILFTGLVLTSCSPLPLQAEHLEHKQVCCTSLNEIKYDDLPASQEKAVSITTDTLAYNFPTGKSYFAAFRLPQNLEKHQLEIKSFRTGLLVSDSQLFCPTAMFLDANYQILARVKVNFTYIPPTWVDNGFWVSKVDVPNMSCYFLTFTEAGVVGSPVALDSNSGGFVFFNGKTYSYIDDGPSTQIYPCGQTGEIAIQVK